MNYFETLQTFVMAVAAITIEKQLGFFQGREVVCCSKVNMNGRGEPIPNVEYSAEETKVWGHVLKALSDLYPTHACKEYLNSYPHFNFTPDRIPQLQELSEVYTP